MSVTGEKMQNDLLAAFLSEFSSQKPITDQPKKVAGNSNTVEKFFKKSTQSSEITGISEEPMKRIRIIIKMLSSMRRVDSVRFGYHASETKKLLEDSSPWFGLTPTVYNILDDSSPIIQHHSLLIGVPTEEAQEARHKECRRFRLHNTKKNARDNCNFDWLSLLLVSPDPIVDGYRDPLPKQGKTHGKVVEILLESNPETFTVRLENSRMCTPFDSECSAEYDTTNPECCAPLPFLSTWRRTAFKAKPSPIVRAKPYTEEKTESRPSINYYG